MSLLDKMKTWGQERTPSDTVGGELALSGAGGLYSNTQADDRPLLAESSASPPPAPARQVLGADSSIITESTPTEAPADFSETRFPSAPAPAPLPPAASLPLIGRMPVAEQQRVLIGLVITGLIGLILMIFLSYNAASRGAAQVGAAGQALMQSQRLAKSITQALVGNVQSFPEVRESTDVLTSTVRGLQNGDGSIAQAPLAARASLEAVRPMVDRAEKNANMVVQKS